MVVTLGMFVPSLKICSSVWPLDGQWGSQTYSCSGCALYNPRGAIYIGNNVCSKHSLWGKRVHLHPILPSVSIIPSKNILHINGSIHI